jgi:hypothetical protein
LKDKVSKFEMIILAVITQPAMTDELIPILIGLFAMHRKQ